MSRIAQVLKDEVTRLARKEVKAQTDVLRRSNAQYRRDIAELKRQAATMARQIAYLESEERKRAAAAPPESAAEGRRFSPRWLKRHRDKLGLSAADYARLVGVSAQTVYNWEHGKSKPQARQLAALVDVRALGKREALRRLELLDG